MDLFLMSLEYPNLVTCMFKILYYSINFREQEIAFFYLLARHFLVLAQDA